MYSSTIKDLEHHNQMLPIVEWVTLNFGLKQFMVETRKQASYPKALFGQ